MCFISYISSSHGHISKNMYISNQTRLLIETTRSKNERMQDQSGSKLINKYMFYATLMPHVDLPGPRQVKWND